VGSPIDGKSLGLKVKECTVVEVVDHRALAFGWKVGDRITAVGASRESQSYKNVAHNTQLTRFELSMLQLNQKVRSTECQRQISRVSPLRYPER
jgi:hypothetical protein